MVRSLALPPCSPLQLPEGRKEEMGKEVLSISFFPFFFSPPPPHSVHAHASAYYPAEEREDCQQKDRPENGELARHPHDAQLRMIHTHSVAAVVHTVLHTHRVVHLLAG